MTRVVSLRRRRQWPDDEQTEQWLMEREWISACHQGHRAAVWPGRSASCAVSARSLSPTPSSPLRGVAVPGDQPVAGINLLWRASEASIASSARSAMAIVNARRFASVAFSIIGAGSRWLR
jgi:hypothetical protein